MKTILKNSAIVGLALFSLVACNEEATATTAPEKPQERPKAPASKPSPSPQASVNIVKTTPRVSPPLSSPVSPLVTGIKIMSQTATVKYMQLEGGFWGLVTDKGHNLLPMNLSAEFRQMGAVVKFTGQVKSDVMTIQQWGTPFYITEMTLIKAGKPVDNNNNSLL